MTQSDFSRARRGSQRHSGFSLIEVAIALVIFVIGAIAILRIFPSGLGLVEKSADTRRADNLNASVLARYRASAGVPDGVFNGGYNAQGFDEWQRFDGFISRFASSQKNQESKSLPASLQSTDFLGSALDKFGAIKGENARIFIKDDGSLALTTQFPIAPNSRIFAYTLEPVLGAKIEIRDNGNALPADDYGSVDFEGATLRDGSDFTPLAGDLVYVTYRYSNGGLGQNAIWTQNSQPIRLASDPTNSQIEAAIPAFTTGTLPVAGAVEVVVRRNLTEGAASDAERRTGVVSLPGTAFSDGDAVRVDYVAVWRTLLQEERLSQAADPVFLSPSVTQPKQLTLAVPLLRDRGRVWFSSAMLLPAGSNRLRVQAADFNGSSAYPIAADVPVITPMNGADPDRANQRAMMREGNIAFNNLPEGARVRVAFQTREDWAQQLSIAARSYKRFNSNARLDDDNNATTAPVLSERWRDFDFAPLSAPTNSPTLVFHASEAGKTVRVAYAFQDGASVSKREEILVIPESLAANTGALLGLPASAQVARLSWTAPGNVLAIQQINGESVNVRTAWLDNVRYNQSLLTSLRGGDE